MADSVLKNERRLFFKQIDEMTRTFEIKKQPLNWFESDGRAIGEIIIERNELEKQEQKEDKQLYTITKDGKKVAWNVPRIEKDIMLDSICRNGEAV